MNTNCRIYGTKKSRYLREQEVKELLSLFGVRIPLSKIPLLGDIDIDIQ